MEGAEVTRSGRLLQTVPAVPIWQQWASKC